MNRFGFRLKGNVGLVTPPTLGWFFGILRLTTDKYHMADEIDELAYKRFTSVDRCLITPFPK